jgi:hypothetical protein
VLLITLQTSNLSGRSKTLLDQSAELPNEMIAPAIFLLLSGPKAALLQGITPKKTYLHKRL